jgi:Ca2+ transporting ATPase
MSDSIRDEADNTITHFNREGLRSIGVGYRDLPSGFDIESKDQKGDPMVESEGFTLIAIIGIKDPVRDGVPQSVEECRNAKIKVRMVTGDNTITARAIARDCNILEHDDDSRCMEGDKFYEAVGGLVKRCKKCLM